MSEQTIQILRDTLGRDPGLWESRQQLAEILWSQGDVQGASDALSSAPQWPNDAGQLEFAAAVFEHTNHDFAVDLYNSALERAPSSASAHAGLARLHMAANDSTTANEHYLAATNLDPSTADPAIAYWLQNGEVPEPEPEPEPQPEPTLAEQRPDLSDVPQSIPDPTHGETIPAPGFAPAHPGAPSLKQKGPKLLDEYPEQFEMVGLDPTSDHAAAEQEIELLNAARKKRNASLIVAALVHVLIGLGLFFWIIQQIKETPVLVVTQADVDPGPPKVEKQTFAKAVRRKPNPASSSAQVITTNVAAPISVEEVEEVDAETFGVAETFGDGFGDGTGDGNGGGGAVMFFGNGETVSRAVFIVDFSSSMREGTRISQLKTELDRSISKLPANVSYRVIYYSHRPWLGGETVGDAPFRDPDEPNDKVRWIKATKDNIQKTREEISNMPLGGATNWIPPVRLALSMEPRPRVIWLLTDGEASDREELIADMDSINPHKVRINTIGMEIGGPTFQSLIDIAEMTGGNYSIVMDGELHTGAQAKKFVDPRFSPGRQQ